MTKFFDIIHNRALRNKSKIILPEKDLRISDAEIRLSDLGYQILKIENYTDRIDHYIQYIKNLNFTNNWLEAQMRDYLHNPINLSMCLLAVGEADAVVAGACNPSSEIIRSAIRMIGVSKNTKWISSNFFMVANDLNQALTYSDCGVIPEPTSEQLVSIAYNAANMHKLLSGQEPRVAFLSFSTKGSANHYRVDRVRNAYDIFKKKYKNIISDGELQFDAAYSSKIYKNKVETSYHSEFINSGANVFIFPNLESGNIAYKITQYIGGYSALGPLLQGLNKPVHDLSRGCSVEDIVNIAGIAALQKK